MNIRIGTRGSDLALWQARFVARALTAHGHACELVILKTRGDTIEDVPLTQVEGKAFFTAEIEGALLAGTVDLAVHSHKDLPTQSPAGLCIAAIPARASSAERLLVRESALEAQGAFLPLPRGARVGTSAPRRTAQVRALRPDLQLLDLRGNVPTRVQRLREGRFDAILLAEAGLERLQLDLGDLAVFRLPQAWFVPAPAQGALAVQAREGDQALISLVRGILHDDAAEKSVAAERALLLRAGGGCNLPLGAALETGPLGFAAHVFLGEGCLSTKAPSRWLCASGSSAQQAIDRAWQALTCGGGARSGPLAGLGVALTGSGQECSTLAQRLETLGADVKLEPVLEFERIDAPQWAGNVDRLRAGDWVAVTSRFAASLLVDCVLPRGVKVAAVGKSTAMALLERGLKPDVVGASGARALAQSVTLQHDARVLFPCAVGARDELEREFRGRGHEVVRCELYRAAPVDRVELCKDVQVRVYTSPSAVAAALHWERAQGDNRLGATERVPLGPTTAAALSQAGLAACAIVWPADGSGEDLIEALLRHFARRLPALERIR